MPENTPDIPETTGSLYEFLWRYRIIVLTVLLGFFGLAFFLVFGPALGLFGGSAPTPTETPGATATATATATPGETASATVATATATATPPPEPPLAGAKLYGGCVSVVHKPLGTFPSYLEWVFEFDPLTIPPGAVVVLRFAEEGSPDVVYEAPIAEGRATLQTGITKYGLKVFTRLSVRVGSGTIGAQTYDITPTFQGFFGASATVTEQEGSLAGNDCPTPILVP